MPAALHRLYKYRTIRSVPYYDWTVNVVADDSSIEYVIVSPDGQTVELSQNGYGTPGAAMLDGLLKCKDLSTQVAGQGGAS